MGSRSYDQLYTIVAVKLKNLDNEKRSLNVESSLIVLFVASKALFVLGTNKATPSYQPRLASTSHLSAK